MSVAAASPRERRGLEGIARQLGAWAADLSAQHLLRQAVFLAAVTVAWVSLKPYESLARADLGDILTGQETLTYLIFGALAGLALVLVFAEHGRALASLATPFTIALALWFCVNVVLSQDPGTSLKRLMLTAAVALLTACLPLLARSRDELRNLLAVSALTLLVLCYIGMIVAPDVTIHQAHDLLEPQLAGDWRGTFAHKNRAAAVMGMLLFVGIGVWRMGWRVGGGAIVFLSGLFLIGCGGKSALALSLFVFALTSLFRIVRSLGGRAVLALGPVVFINVFSVGTVMNDGLARLVASLPIDATFTGRTDIWRFAIDSLASRPITGFGFAAFWGTERVREVASDDKSWAGIAAHSHNGYVDTALTLGLVGLLLTVLVLLIGPLRAYQRADADGTPAGPAADMFLQLWLFGVLLSAMESFFFDRADAIWFTFLIAVFGLHYMARFRTR